MATSPLNNLFSELFDSRKKRHKTLLLQLSDAAPETRARALADLSEHPENLSDEIITALRSTFAASEELANRLQIVALMDDLAFLESALADPALTDAAARRIAQLTHLRDPNPVQKHHSVLAARVALCREEEILMLAEFISDADQLADLAIKAKGEIRQRLLKHSVLVTEAGLAALEKKSRGRDKNCNRHARGSLEALKQARADFASSSTLVQNVNATITKTLAETPANLTSTIIQREKLIALKNRRDQAITNLVAVQDQLVNLGITTEPLDFTADPLSGVDLSVPKPSDDPFIVLTERFAALGEAMRAGEPVASVSQERDALTDAWLAAADTFPPSAAQHAVFEATAKDYRHYLQANERFATIKWPDLTAMTESGDKPKLSNDIRSRSAWAKGARAALQRLNWPNQFAAPEVVRQTETALSRTDSELAKLEQQLQDLDQEMGRAIKDIRSNIDQGQLKAALTRLSEARKMQRQGVRRFDKPLNQLSQELGQLTDWQDFVTQPKRGELLAQLVTLADQPLAAKPQADRVKQLRQEWNALGRLRQDEATLQSRFDELAEQAFAHCKIAFQEQAKDRERNLQGRINLCEQLQAFCDDSDWQSLDLKVADTIMRQARKEWQILHPCDRKALRPVAERFEYLQEQLNSHIKGIREASISAKQALVEAAIALTKQDDSYAATSEVKTLQEQWQAIQHTPHGVNQRLWKEFRAACDAVFAKRKTDVSAERAVVESEQLEIDTAINQMFEQFETLAINELQTSVAQLSDRAAQLPRAGAQHARLRDLSQQIAARQSKERTEKRFSKIDQWLNWDVEVSQQEEDGTGGAVPHAAFAVRQSERSVDEDLERLTLEAEIAADIASPESKQSERMNLQIELMNTGRRHNQLKDTDTLIKRWCMTGPKTRAHNPLRERFFTAVKLTLSGTK